ncbi:flavodoxin family protein [Thalassobacillus sp. CUG 92003]|uniref:flavodoxin family protein n=1 Tax=Thalassobacillus sp. CUG 92003 TaxID=2736641 RepID=UPI0021051023|nr:flavodoxin family protein [Thalassobacillus sp. CUG 92003]
MNESMALISTLISKLTPLITISSNMKAVVLYGNTRENGNTEVMTERAIKNLSAHRVFLKDLEINHVVDQRHEENGFTRIQDDYDQVILSMIDADVIIFATLIYWYGMSSIMKIFMRNFI